jgi:hypothetical protein
VSLAWPVAVANIGVEPVTISVEPAAFVSLAKLPRIPASDLKKLGWHGMMNMLRSKGKFLVTNHDEPEAVIIPVAEYEDLMRLAAQSEAQAGSPHLASRHELPTSFVEAFSVRPSGRR